MTLRGGLSNTDTVTLKGGVTPVAVTLKGTNTNTDAVTVKGNLNVSHTLKNDGLNPFTIRLEQVPGAVRGPQQENLVGGIQRGDVVVSHCVVNDGTRTDLMGV